MEGILDNLKGFSGSGLLFVLLLASVLFLGFKLKKGPARTLTVLYPIFVLAVFFCPLWIVYMRRATDGEILYRIMWMIPFAVIICYALIEAVFMVPRKCRAAAFAGAVLIIVMSGKYLYTNPHFSKAENIYHVPQEVADICDDVRVQGREIKVCFPTEFIQYVRQYSPYIALPYGRSILLGYGNNESNHVDEFMNMEVIDTEGLVGELRKSVTAYVVLEKEREMTEDIEKYDYSLVRSYGNYNLYFDNQAYIGLWDEEDYQEDS